MTKEDLGNALSLSCVENYFLAFFKDKIDVRQLYVESFVPINTVFEDFLKKGASYENYALTRIQDTSEKLGLTTHILNNEFLQIENALNLIRVNKSFFSHSKQLPWRADHFVAIEKLAGDYKYFNNYPLSCGVMNQGEINKIFDGQSLNYVIENHYNSEKHIELADLQYNTITHQEMKSIKIEEEQILNFRSAMLVLKTIRKRLVDWLKFESEHKRFLYDIVFQDFCKDFIALYEKLFVKIEVQIARKRISIDVLKQDLDGITKQENDFSRLVKLRRVKNECIR